MNNEIWKPIGGFEGIYEVSSLGRVKMLPHYVRRTANARALIKGKIVAPWKTQKGYLCVDLYRNNRVFHKKIHRLVAEAFIENPLQKPQVDHIDTNKRNNNVDNLRWATPSENKNNPLTRKLHSEVQSRPDVIERSLLNRQISMSRTRERPVCQSNNSNVIMGMYKSIHEASRQTGIASSLICRACKGQRKLAGGFRWKYL